jgi:hypothetical protein
MAPSGRFRASGLEHSAVQRDRQPAYRRMAEAELEAQTLKSIVLASRSPKLCDLS